MVGGGKCDVVNKTPRMMRFYQQRKRGQCINMSVIKIIVINEY
ncbi:hypothetical protein AC26_2752 [Escherichia coli 1-176-05_S3_C2]|nr:hypothetical protein AC26_2752 [Escherichia coli 1-176-05_S3_C2]